VAVVTRRERQRQETRDEILGVARRQLAEQGAANLSLRAIAAALGLTAPAIYRYFASRDALLTALIVDAYDDLGAALTAAPFTETAASSLRARMLAYRRWALGHPEQFTLVFGTPVPGYAAPREETVPAVRRAFAAFVAPVAEAVGGLGGDPPGQTWPPALREQVLLAWADLHGLVMLELTGHLRPAVADVDALVHAGIDAATERVARTLSG
jgi:AcrR family transcriptional regulator